MAAPSSVPPTAPSQPSIPDVEITIVSAKHLKNVNWRNGPLLPYATVYLISDTNHRFSTQPDDSNSTRPIWNERFFLPYHAFSSPDSILAVDIFHSRPSETPKPSVGSLRVAGAGLLPDSPFSSSIVHSLNLLRPSGRPQGKLRIKVSLCHREIEPSLHPPAAARYYNFAPGSAYYYSPSACYPAGDYYPPHPPPLPAHAFVRPSSQPLPRAPPAPVDCHPVAPYSPPPSVRDYGRNHDCVVETDSVYGPSAPVDFTYPAKERKPCPSPQPNFHYASSSFRPLSRSDFTYIGTPPHWSSSRSVSWRNDHNSLSLERERIATPSGSSLHGYRRVLDEVAVAGAFEGLRLKEENGMRGSDHAYSHGYNHGD